MPNEAMRVAVGPDARFEDLIRNRRYVVFVAGIAYVLVLTTTGVAVHQGNSPNCPIPPIFWPDCFDPSDTVGDAVECYRYYLDVEGLGAADWDEAYQAHQVIWEVAE